MREYSNSFASVPETSVPVFSGIPEFYLARGSHVAYVFREEHERLNLLAPFMRAGLEAGDQCVLIAPSAATPIIIDRLRQLGTDVETAMASAQLLVSEVGGSTSIFEAAILSAERAGRDLIRIGGDMSSASGEAATGSELAECLFDQAVEWPRSRLIALCQYDGNRLGGSAILGAIKAHSLSIVGNIVHENPFYREPRELLRALPDQSLETVGLNPLDFQMLLVTGSVTEREQDAERICRWLCDTAASMLGVSLVALVTLRMARDGHGAVYGRMAGSLLTEPLASDIGELAQMKWFAAQTPGTIGLLHEADLPPGVTGQGIRQVAWLPVRTLHKKLALLMVGTEDPWEPDSQARLVLTTLANQAAVALEAVSLRRKDRGRIDRLTTFNRLVRAVSSSLDLQQVLLRLSSEVQQLIPHDRASIALMDPSEETADIYTVTGQSASLETGGVIPIADSNLGQIIETGQGYVQSELVQEEEELAAKIGLAIGIRSSVAVPLWDADDCFGSLNFGTYQAGKYGDNELNLAQEIADQVALAILNARIHQDVRSLAVAEERNRLALEIHDTLSQELTGIVVQLEAAEAALGEDRSQARVHLRRARTQARESGQEARRSVWNLLPRALEEDPLDVALEEEVRRFNRVGGERAYFSLSGDRRQLPTSIEVALLRICQESLTNVRRHARATDVRVRLSYRSESVSLTVQDNGIGFDVHAMKASRNESGFGLAGMEQRVRPLGGTISVTSESGEGTRVEVVIPNAAEESTSLTIEERRRGKSNMGIIKLLIVDDHTVVRDGLIGILASEDDFAVVGAAGSGLEAVKKARELHPNVILMDLRMPELDGAEAIRQIRAENPDAKFVVLTSYDADEYVFEAIEAGAMAYLLKDSPKERLFHALRAVHRGQSLIDPSVAATVLNRMAQLSRRVAVNGGGVLSRREVEVLNLIAVGTTNKEIGILLSISQGTVKTHAYRIFQKLDVKDRTEAVTTAVRKGIITLD